jgi:hypothetical protein
VKTETQEGETGHRRYKHSPREKKKGRCAFRLFGTYSLNEEAMSHVDPLLGDGH